MQLSYYIPSFSPYSLSSPSYYSQNTDDLIWKDIENHGFRLDSDSFHSINEDKDFPREEPYQNSDFSLAYGLIINLDERKVDKEEKQVGNDLIVDSAINSSIQKPKNFRKKQDRNQSPSISKNMRRRYNDTMLSDY